MFKPLNRYLLIEKPSQKPNETQSGIVLPDDYKPIEAPHVVVKLVDYAEDVRFKQDLRGLESQVAVNELYVMVDRSMIEEIVHNGTNYCMILDNYVKGVFTK
tara:strand:- start:193 stop:498 length:306 start_codon:yes stop_codon:yes gene_type:complete